MALGAVVDESGLEAGLDAGDAALVDVRLLLFPGGNLDRKVVKLLAVNEGDAQFFLLRRIDKHSLHGPLLGITRGPMGDRRKKTVARGSTRKPGLAGGRQGG